MPNHHDHATTPLRITFSDSHMARTWEWTLHVAATRDTQKCISWILLVVWKSYTSKSATMNTYEPMQTILYKPTGPCFDILYSVEISTCYIHPIYIQFCSQNLSMYPCTSCFGSGANLCCRSEPFVFGKFMVQMTAPHLGMNLHWNIYVRDLKPPLKVRH